MESDIPSLACQEEAICILYFPEEHCMANKPPYLDKPEIQSHDPLCPRQKVFPLNNPAVRLSGSRSFCRMYYMMNLLFVASVSLCLDFAGIATDSYEEDGDQTSGQTSWKKNKKNAGRQTTEEKFSFLTR
ncbi:unnamed protein product [Ranitomeya imitator]|uniref:Uncharacterized protein n=1 Tax=Ranitomeya imitator TaxID=111125 RepID=A0ABN9L3R5_9NEOB|nr:unnamed protein product [Ranitomeya imitator]